MCGRLANGATPEEIAAWHEARRNATLAIRDGDYFLPSYNTAPTHVVTILRDEGEQAVLEPMSWGVWATFGPRGKRSQRFLINATSEKYVAGGRSMWARGWKRCLVVASCFFEWEGKGRAGQAHAIRVADDELLAFGALWKIDVRKRRKDDEEAVKGPVVVILTCPPNDLVERFHHRAPVIVPPEHWDAWLDPDTPRDVIAQLCLPLPSEAMVAYPVPNEVGKVGVQDPAFLDGV